MTQFEAEKRMPYITSIERRGRSEALRNAILDILTARFDEIPFGLREQVLAISDEKLLKQLPRLAAVAKSLKDFQKHL